MSRRDETHFVSYVPFVLYVLFVATTKAYRSSQTFGGCPFALGSVDSPVLIHRLRS